MADPSYQPLLSSEDASSSPIVDVPGNIGSFDTFAQGPVSKAPATPSASALAEPPGVAELPPTRFINIPELPLASSEWHSEANRLFFVCYMALSIWQLIISVPFCIALVGIFPLLAAVFGIVLSSVYLCDCCQSVLLEANVKVTWVCAIVALCLDGFFNLLTIPWAIALWVRSNHHRQDMGVVSGPVGAESFEFDYDYEGPIEDGDDGGGAGGLVLLFLVTFLLHNIASAAVMLKARRLRRLLHPIQSGMAVSV